MHTAEKRKKREKKKREKKCDIIERTPIVTPVEDD